MTVQAQNPVASYTANGITTDFTLAAKVLTSTDLKVYLNGVLQSSGYTVSGIGDSGGVTVEFSFPPASGVNVVLHRELPVDRSTDYPFGGNLSSDVIDMDQDRQTMIMQQLSESIDRSMTLAPGVSADTELPAPESNKLLGWNVSGTALENKSPSSGGIVIASDVSFTPTGTISATNVQDAIAEVAAEAGGGGGGPAGVDTLAALRLESGYANGDIIEVFGHSAKGDGGGGQFKFDSSLSVADDNGVVIRPSTNPPTGRWVRVAYYEGKPLSVRWYGAKGDGTTDDTSALQATINQCQALIRSVYVPAGTYITQPLTYASTAYAAQVAIIGENSNETIIKKKSGASTDPLLTIGSASATNFTAELRVENITFDGLAKASTTDGIKAYDLVRSSFTSCIFVNSGINFYGLGGIYITFRDCTFDAGNTGARFEKFTSLAGGGWPNGISFENCFLINNSSWGLWFEDGRLVTLDQCEIEGNGTSGNSSTGGVRIGTNIGGEGGGATPNSIGLRARDLWCEANAGAASVVLLGGKNTIENSYFVANANATYDIYINGGTYRLDKCVSDSAKTYNIYEDSGASGPSWINACEIPTLNYNPNKTYIDYGETNRSRFSFHNNGNDYAATSGVATEMTFGSTDFIAGGTKLGNGFQSLVNGVYRVNAQVGIVAIGNGAYFKIYIYKNGALYKNGVTVANTTGGVAGGQTSISCLVPVSVGDVITARYFMSHAGATVEGTATQSYFQGEKI